METVSGGDCPKVLARVSYAFSPMGREERQVFRERRTK